MIDNIEVKFVDQSSGKRFTVVHQPKPPYAIVSITKLDQYARPTVGTQKQQDKFQRLVWKSYFYKLPKTMPAAMGEALRKYSGVEFTHFALMTHAGDAVLEWKLHFQRLVKEGRLQKTSKTDFGELYRFV